MVRINKAMLLNEIVGLRETMARQQSAIAAINEEIGKLTAEKTEDKTDKKEPNYFSNEILQEYLFGEQKK